ncbi:MAG: 3-hydroxybutyryl-CoA dehydrogenase [Chloroflexi bacterium]|nr:3-hydroxybutyryl-CoA dehydrogenase [Chloroflexota bacterium]
MAIKAIAVVGAGTMGSGIAHVAAQSGFEVLLLDRSQEMVERGLERIGQILGRGVARGLISEAQKQEALARVRPAAVLDEVGTTPLVIEAVFEDFDTKAALLRQLDSLCPPEAILASNTSTLPITELAAVTRRPEQVVGMHFFNPVYAMRLVEVIKGYRTADETVAAAVAVTKELGKTPVVVKDSPGFVANRLLAPLINEAAFMLTEGICSKEDIDTIMKLGANHPMGPLELADLIGLDVCLAEIETLYRTLGDSKYRPALLLKQLVAAGHLGRKTGHGFYQYN